MCIVVLILWVLWLPCSVWDASGTRMETHFPRTRRRNRFFFLCLILPHCLRMYIRVYTFVCLLAGMSRTGH